MKEENNIYKNFSNMIYSRHSNLGWHWRGKAEIQGSNSCKNCPKIFRDLFKDIHSQLLQWSSNEINGEFIIPKDDLFENENKYIEIKIVDKIRKGYLYKWIEKYSDSRDPWVNTYIFVENESDFCHLILQVENFYIPTAFYIHDFLYLYGQTRGLENTYYVLAFGLDGKYIKNLLNLDSIFPNFDLSYCLETFYKQQFFLLKKDFEELPKESINISINLKNNKLCFNIDNVEISLDDDFVVDFFEYLLDHLVYVETCKSATFNENFHYWNFNFELYSLVETFYFIQVSKHVIHLKLENNSDLNSIEIYCDSKVFYINYLKFIEDCNLFNKNDKSFIKNLDLLRTMLKFYYGFDKIV